MAGACVFALLFAAAPAHGVWPVVAGCVFNGVSVGGWNALDMMTAELYPTTVCGQGSSAFTSLAGPGRAANGLQPAAAYSYRHSAQTLQLLAVCNLTWHVGQGAGGEGG